jgi:hypothetical protein
MTQQPIATGRLTLDDTAVQDFTASLRGEVLRPTDEGYDDARIIHNGMIDRRPTLIARCAGVADVIGAGPFPSRSPFSEHLRSRRLGEKGRGASKNSGPPWP